ncbi:MAG: hypothetical protein IPK04_03250 [Bdellovibrionales bacterium]|nr:hypothetical protein [Bdellovibrionales bacterium]
MIDSGNQMNFTLSATAIAGSGTVIPSFAAGAFKDLAGNNGTASTSNDNTVTYDPSLPKVLSVTSRTSDGIYVDGNSISIQVKFDKAVFVSGAPPSLTLETGPVNAIASYSAGSGTDTLTFDYVVTATDFSADLELENPSINSNGGWIKDTYGNQTSLSVPTSGGDSLSGSKNLRIVGTPALLTVTSPYPGNANWNDYVKFADPNKKVYKQVNTACDGSEVESIGRAGGCIHSGEIRKVHLPSLSSCNNLTATDTLGNFYWVCDDSEGAVNFYSAGFQKGKGLRDLFDVNVQASPIWKTNKVEIRYFNSLIGESSQQAWWTNALENAFPGGDITMDTTVNLSNYGTIYYIPSPRQAYILNIANDKIALVTLNGSTLSANGVMPSGGAGNCNTADGTIVSGNAGASALICLGSRKFLWIETDLLGIGTGLERAAAGILAYDLKHSCIH